MMATKCGYAQDQPEGFSNKIENVAVVGVGGRMGKPIAQALLDTGKHRVTAITRPNSDTSAVPPGVRVTQVDYSGDGNDDEQAKLVAVLSGQQALIITMSVTAPRNTIPKLVRAAIKAGVKYILPNWYGQDAANQALCDECMLTPMRDIILAEFADVDPSSTAYFLLCCNFWYAFSLGGGPDRFGFDLKARTLTLFDEGDVAINVTTWSQCARAVANLLSLKMLPENEADNALTLSHFANKEVYISSFRLSQRDMLESVQRVTQTTSADWTIRHESVEQRWKESYAAARQGDVGGMIRTLYSRNFFPGGGGEYESRVQLANELLHLPVEDLDTATTEAVRMGLNDEVVKAHHERARK